MRALTATDSVVVSALSAVVSVFIPRGVHNHPGRWLSGSWFATSAIVHLVEGLVATVLWILAVILVIAGIVTALGRQRLFGIVLIARCPAPVIRSNRRRGTRV